MALSVKVISFVGSPVPPGPTVVQPITGMGLANFTPAVYAVVELWKIG